MNPRTRLVFWLGKQLAFPPLEFVDGGKRKTLPPGSSAWAKFARWFGEIQPADEAGLSAGSAALDAIDAAWRKLGHPEMPAAPQFTTGSRAAA
jgi:hypothetical protein